MEYVYTIGGGFVAGALVTVFFGAKVYSKVEALHSKFDTLVAKLEAALKAKL